MLAVREKLRELRRTSTRDLSKPDKDQNNEIKRRTSKDDDDDDVDCDDVRMTSDLSLPMTLSSDRQQQLIVKCVKLLTQKHFLEVATNAQVRVTVGTFGGTVRTLTTRISYSGDNNVNAHLDGSDYCN